MYLLYLHNKLMGYTRSAAVADMFISDNGALHTRVIYKRA